MSNLLILFYKRIALNQKLIKPFQYIVFLPVLILLRFLIDTCECSVKIIENWRTQDFQNDTNN